MTPPRWDEGAEELRAMFDGAPFELRYALHGRAAVRVLAPSGPVAARHVEPPEVSAPWAVTARCGEAAGWLLAGAAPAGGGERARAALRAAIDRHTALALQELEAVRAALAADLLESLTHRLRTDVSTLQAVAEGALAGVFTDDELEQIPAELKVAGGEAQRRLSQAREIMGALRPEAPWRAEPVAGILEAELEGAGAAVRVGGVDGEIPLALGRGAGWGACARLLAAALARDARLGGERAEVTVAADPGGWAVTAGAAGEAERVAWTGRALGELVHAGPIVAAAGGSVSVARVAGEGVRVRLVLPAAPPGDALHP